MTNRCKDIKIRVTLAKKVGKDYTDSSDEIALRLFLPHMLNFADKWNVLLDSKIDHIIDVAF
jgi:hypothetical protein